MSYTMTDQLTAEARAVEKKMKAVAQTTLFLLLATMVTLLVVPPVALIIFVITCMRALRFQNLKELHEAKLELLQKEQQLKRRRSK